MMVEKQVVGPGPILGKTRSGLRAFAVGGPSGDAESPIWVGPSWHGQAPAVEETRTLSLLHEISRELNSILDRCKLFGRIAELVKELIEFDQFNLFLWDEESHELVNCFSHRFGEPIHERGRLALGEGVCGIVALKKRVLLVPDVRLHPGFIDCDPSAGVASELAAPLLCEDRLIGVINLESTRQDAFSARHEKILDMLASSIAVSLENARLYGELRKREEALQRDLEMARTVQRCLLPDRPPRLVGLDIGCSYRPALQLGGDFLDFLPHGRGRMGFAIGDVSGKSTAAALYGSMAVGILRAPPVQQQLTPVEVMTQLNGQLVDLNMQNRFLAMIYGIYDADSGRLSLANSGLPKPLLVRGNRVVELPLVGVPLGLFQGSGYQQIEVELKPGDLLVFFSDGLPEVYDRSDREYGVSGLTGALLALKDRPAQEIADGLVRASIHFGGICPKNEDDRTVLVLKRDGGGKSKRGRRSG